MNLNDTDAIAYLCCDNMNTTATPNDMLNALMNKPDGSKPRAILLYTQVGQCCGLGGTELPYQTILTMTDAEEAGAILNNTLAGDGIVQASISGNATDPNESAQAGQNGNNSAVAMSILYSITGLITLLFLIIIATGAIRAHRYPERYGPRSAYGGRPRQSRAKGIARAVLETIPIVKFGTPAAPAKSDPNIELERAQPATDVQVHHLSTIPEDVEAQPKATNSPERESRIGSNSPKASGSQQTLEPLTEEHLGCSICTEDFNVGEDVRVLPCDHKFHPPCIDPWLVNVSGTCPLW